MGRRRIAGTRVLLTDASRGIGRELAAQLAVQGARVVATARSLDLLHELADVLEAHGSPLHVVAADVTVPTDRERLRQAVQTHLGGLDLLINAASTGATGLFVESQPQRLRSIMEVNLFGTAEMVRMFLPLLRRGRAPAIVNFSSIGGKRGLPGRSEFCASKFAVVGFSQALRAELAPEHIDVLVMCPGLVQSAVLPGLLGPTHAAGHDDAPDMPPNFAADDILTAIRMGSNETWLTWHGQLLLWLNRFAPRLVDALIKRRMRHAPEQVILTAPANPPKRPPTSG